MPFKLVGDTSGNNVEVDASKRMLVALSGTSADAGFVKLAGPDGQVLDATADGHLFVSQDTTVMFDPIDGTAVNTNIWNPYSVSGMTITQAAGYIVLNGGSAVTANAYAILQSIKNLILYSEFPLFIAMDLKINVAPQANITIEFGVLLATTNGAPTDGCFFRYYPDGTFRAVSSFGGSETTATLVTPTANILHDFDISIETSSVRFTVDDTQEVTIPVPSGLPFPVSTTRIPVVVRVYNGASSPSTAPVISIGRINAIQKAITINRPWDETIALLGRAAYQSPLTPFAQSANHANSTAPAAVTLSNTAAGYATLGGKFAVNSQAAGATDGILFGFQVPANYQLVIKSITISAAITGAAIVTATVLDWALGLNSSALSLATADGAGTWAPRRIPLGVQGFAALAGIGTVGGDLIRSFETPLIVDSGRYLHVILTIPNGTNTGSLVYRGVVMINGYFE